MSVTAEAKLTNIQIASRPPMTGVEADVSMSVHSAVPLTMQTRGEAYRLARGPEHADRPVEIARDPGSPR